MKTPNTHAGGRSGRLPVRVRGHQAIGRVRQGPGAHAAPAAPRSLVRRYLPVSAAFAAGAGLATVAAKRRLG